MLCSKCNKEATFTSPKRFCDECWCEWWVSSVEDPIERQKYYEETLKNLKEDSKGNKK